MGNAPESLNDHKWYMQTRNNIALFRHIAQDVVKKYEKGMRDKLDEHARPVQFLEGDLVYMYDPTATENTASKFSNVYRGPYRVVASLSTGKEIPHFVNIKKLKRAYGPWSPALTKPTNKKHPTNKEISDQSRNSTPDQNRTTRSIWPGAQVLKIGWTRRLHSIWNLPHSWGPYNKP